MDISSLKQILQTLLQQQQAIAEQVAVVRAELAKRQAAGEDSATPATPTDLVQVKTAMPPLVVKSRKGIGGRPRKALICTIPGCGQEHVAKGLCATHYSKERRRMESARLAAKPS